MPKQIVFDQAVREALKRGVQRVASAVRCTLGPRGRTVVIDKSWGAPTVTKDGASVCEEVELIDPHENMAAKMIKEAASKTSDQAGDGTATSATLAEAIFLDGLKRVVSGADAMALSRGIRRAVAVVAEDLKSFAKSVDVQEKDRVAQIGAVASGGDRAVGEMLAGAFAKVGKEGAVSVEEGKSIRTEIKIVEGMQFDRGFASPHFVTDSAAVEAVLEEPYVLIHEDKLSSAGPLVPLLEKMSASGRPLLVIAEDIEGEALATLVVNKLRGIFQACAVKAPGYGDRRRAMLEDIAVLTGGRALLKDLGVDLEKVTLQMLGRCKRVIVDADNTTIIQGAGSSAEVQGRCAQIRKELEASDSDYDREKLTERLSKLSGGVAQVLVGAPTETELKERKHRVEDALHSVRAALEEGVVPGGGVALLRASRALEGLVLQGDEKAGVDVVRQALEIPLRLIASSGGQDGSLAVRRVRESGGALGYDAEKGEFADLEKSGIVDPLKVTRCALLNAGSVAGLLLTTEVLVSEIPEEESERGSGAESHRM